MPPMLLPVPPDDPFSGVLIRLQRANENIVYLQCEIRRFFQECKYPVMPDTDDERWQEALNYHRSLPIPKRFGVLAGEIFHHWRSCLDHIVWIFSSAEYRESHESAIQFPVVCDSSDSDAMKRFKRQVKGVANPSGIRDLIVKLQPYNLGIDAINSPIKIVHDMDRFDKHRELLVVHSVGNLLLYPDAPPEVRAALAAYTDDELTPPAERMAAFRALHKQGKVLPDVAFAEFGNRKTQPMIPSLQILGGEMEKIVAIFMAAGS